MIRADEGRGRVIPCKGVRASEGCISGEVRGRGRADLRWSWIGIELARGVRADEEGMGLELVRRGRGWRWLGG